MVEQSTAETPAFPHVGLFAAGCRVSVPESQTCCGQPAYNAGDQADARAIALNTLAAFEPFDYVVTPSGSCAAMIRVHYPRLFADDPENIKRFQALASKTYELTLFLKDIVDSIDINAKFNGKVTYHDACSGLREMAIKEQPRALLGDVVGLELVEADQSEACCGFGGLFSVKYPDISTKMVSDKTDLLIATGADMVLGGDLGCLMNIAGRLKRRGSNLEVRHVAEVLADMTADVPPVAGKDKV